MNSDSGLLFRRTPLASGSAYVAAAVLVGTALLLRPSQLPDVPAGDVRTQLAAIESGSSGAFDGVRVAIPRGWAFARYAHSPRLQSRMTVPGLGQVPVGPRRSVVFAAYRTPGLCSAILERDSIEHMNLEDDAAAIRRAAQNVYERNVSAGPHDGVDAVGRVADLSGPPACP